MKKILPKTLLIIAAGLLLAACTSQPSTSNTQSNTSTPTTSTNFTLTDIAQHAASQDCWMAINSKVYDVSAYIAQGQHPGGEKVLLGCGKDATDLFTGKSKMGFVHSAVAQQLLAKYKIGDLE